MSTRYAGARIRKLPTVWESFATSVIEQLVTSGEALFAIRRLHLRHGREITGTGGVDKTIVHGLLEHCLGQLSIAQGID